MKDKDSMKNSAPRPFPWWLSLLIAIGSYCTLKYILPTIQTTHPVLQHLTKAAPILAPIIAILFLLLAAKQLYDSDLPTSPDTDQEMSEKSSEEGRNE